MYFRKVTVSKKDISELKHQVFSEKIKMHCFI